MAIEQQTGLPSEREMREQVETMKENFRQRTAAELARYKELFTRFKAGGELTDEETHEMTQLSDRLNTIAQQHHTE